MHISSRFFRYVMGSISSGYAFGPLVSALMFHLTQDSAVEAQVGNETVVVGYDNLWWNRVTAPGWLVLFCVIAEWLLIFCCLPEPKKESGELALSNSDSPLRALRGMAAGEKWGFFVNLLATFCLPVVVASWEIQAVNEAVFTWQWGTAAASVTRTTSKIY